MKFKIIIGLLLLSLFIIGCSNVDTKNCSYDLGCMDFCINYYYDLESLDNEGLAECKTLCKELKDNNGGFV